MGWSIGYDNNWQRDIGYGVPALCDHPDCEKEIDRGLSYVCGNDVYGGEYGCGLFFCEDHKNFYKEVDEETEESEEHQVNLCEPCSKNQAAFTPKPDIWKWLIWKLIEDSWEVWRQNNPEKVKKIKEELLNIIE